MKRTIKNILGICLFASAVTHTHAIIFLDFTETGGDVQLTVSGNIDLTGAFDVEGETLDAFTSVTINPNFVGGSSVDFLVDDSVSSYSLYFVETFAPFGLDVSSSTMDFNLSGDVFFLDSSGLGLALPGPELTSASLSSFATFMSDDMDDLSFTDLGLVDDGNAITIATFASGDTFVVRVGSAIPEPETYALLFGCVGILFAVTRRRI